MARTGSLLFYDVLEPNQTEPDETQASQQDSTIETPNRVATITVIGLFALSPILVIFAKPITAYTESVAEQQFDSQRYVESVLSKQPVTAVEE
jgi:multicomponent K+:H+ antiporter subunit D